MKKEILAMRNVVKIYPNGVVANKDANLSVREGEIHALVGENGAGKSTLMKILFGIEQPTDGTISLYGKELHIKSPLDAIDHGLGMVHQHFMLVESMSVAENIVLGAEPGRLFALDKREMVKQAEEIIRKYNFTVNPMLKIRDLPIGTRQKVEILKALFKGARILILDEPTAVLTPQETEELFRELKGLKDRGHTIIFISHKLNEIKELCDRITILRNGTTVGTYDVGAVSQNEISNLMVGKNMEWEISKPQQRPGDILLCGKNLTVVDEAKRCLVDDVSFSVHAGTILGIVGVEGNGQSELVDAITGMRKPDAGKVFIGDVDITKSSIHDIRRLGMAHIPQDRMERGVALDSSIQDNMFAAFMEDPRLTKGPVLRKKEIKSWAGELVRKFTVKAGSPDVQIKMLSGGNIQKVIVARELSSDSSVIIADQPTRGIDVGAAKLVHEQLVKMRSEGKAILLISADLAEVMEISDSLLVMYGGRFSAYFPDARAVTENELGQYMLGLKKQRPEEIAKCMS